MGNFYLVLKTQKQILLENNKWGPIKHLMENPLRPMMFSSVDAAKCYKKASSLCKKITIHTEKSLQETYHINPLDFSEYRLDPFYGDKKSQEPQIDMVVDEDEVDDDLEEDLDNSITCFTNIKETMETPLITETEDLLSSLMAFISRVNRANDELPKELKNIEQVLQDELHYTEFEKLNVVDGYKAWQRLHDARIERRRIKNEIEVVEMLSSILDPITELDLQSVLTHIDHMKARKYRPRSDQYPTTKIS